MLNGQPECTLVLTYNSVDGYAEGSYGNGRVVIRQIDREAYLRDYAKDPEKAQVGFRMRSMDLIGRNVVEAYVYLGKVMSADDDAAKIFNAMWGLATAAVKDKSRIHIVGCCCNEQGKKRLAQSMGCDFIQSDCGGEGKLGRIVQGILATVPKEPVGESRRLELREEFVGDDAEDGVFSRQRVRRLSAVGEMLVAGCSGGEVAIRRNGRWERSALKLRQGVNLMVPDGDTLLLGDGGCCSGSTWRLKPSDGTFERILPVAGQGPTDERDAGDLNCNIHGFARRGDELLTGGGGCCGTHIYRLNPEGRWEYHPRDPEKYVNTMLATSDGAVYVSTAAGGSFSASMLHRYEGETFHNVGRVLRGGIFGLFEHDGTVYAGGTDSGCIHPTTFSNGFIHAVKGKETAEEWHGAGGVDGFFVHRGQLYAFGANHADWSTSILLRQADGSWTKVARFDDHLALFGHQGTVFAGGAKKVGEKSAPVVYRVEGL